MAEHRYSNVYNYQCLTLVLYLYLWNLISPLIPFPSYSLSPSYIGRQPVNQVENYNSHKFLTKKIKPTLIDPTPKSHILILNCQKKVNNNEDRLDHLYKCKFIFWQKEKKKIGQYTAKLTFLWFVILVKKRVAAIPKIQDSVYIFWDFFHEFRIS